MDGEPAPWPVTTRWKGEKERHMGEDRKPADFKRMPSLGEEIANSVSHGIGLAAAVAGTCILIPYAMRRGDTGFVAGACVFSSAMIILYLTSTLYHALPAGKAKRVFRIIEHSAIFLLIAGTYTPFTLGVLRGPVGWSLFGIVWGLAAGGIVLKSFNNFSHPVLSTLLYIAMGWLIVMAAEPLVARVPTAGIIWLACGGLAYTAGVIFFATGSMMQYGHLIWHIFVLAGSVCHYFAVLWYAA